MSKIDQSIYFQLHSPLVQIWMDNQQLKDRKNQCDVKYTNQDFEGAKAHGRFPTIPGTWDGWGGCCLPAVPPTTCSPSRYRLRASTQRDCRGCSQSERRKSHGYQESCWKHPAPQCAWTSCTWKTAFFLKGDQWSAKKSTYETSTWNSKHGKTPSHILLKELQQMPKTQRAPGTVFHSSLQASLQTHTQTQHGLQHAKLLSIDNRILFDFKPRHTKPCGVRRSMSLLWRMSWELPRSPDAQRAREMLPSPAKSSTNWTSWVWRILEFPAIKTISSTNTQGDFHFSSSRTTMIEQRGWLTGRKCQIWMFESTTWCQKTYVGMIVLKSSWCCRGRLSLDTNKAEPLNAISGWISWTKSTNAYCRCFHFFTMRYHTLTQLFPKFSHHVWEAHVKCQLLGSHGQRRTNLLNPFIGFQGVKSIAKWKYFPILHRQNPKAI